MKEIRAIVLILLLFFSIACEEESVSPADETQASESQNIYNKFIMEKIPNASQQDMYFINSQDGLAVGYYGKTYKTNNSGNNWEEASAPDNVDLLKLYVINKDNWFCSTKHLEKNYIYKIKNNVWKKIDLPPMHENDYVNSFSFVDENNGYIATSRDWTNSAPHLMFKTIDGGVTWDTVGFYKNTNRVYYPSEVYMLDVNNGLAIQKVRFYVTNDGWETFYVSDPEGLDKISGYNYPSISGFAKIDNKHLIAVGGSGFGSDEGFICTSSDGGNSWELAVTNHTLRDVDVTDSKIFVCGSDSYVAKCDIDINNFTPQQIVENLKPYSCSYDEGSDFFSSGTKPWGAKTEFTMIQFSDNTHGFIASDVYLFKITLQ